MSPGLDVNEMKSLAGLAQAFGTNLGTNLVIRAGRTHGCWGPALLLTQ